MSSHTAAGPSHGGGGGTSSSPGLRMPLPSFAAAESSTSVPTLTTIDDAVSLIRSAAEASASTGMTGTQRLLLAALSKLHHAQKGKGYRVFLDTLQGGIDPLSMLTPSQHTLGYAYILATRASNAPDAASAATLVPALENYAQALEPLQLAGAGDIATSLARGIVHVASLIGDHVWAIPSLLRVFDAFRSVNGGTHNLTTMHAIVVYQCLRTAHYHVAYDWAVQYDIVSADSSASPLAYTDVLEYFYYAGLVCTKIDDLERAADLFEQCVCAPAQVVSAIQVDAYKKLLLVQLLKDGSTSPLPRYVSQAVSRSLRGHISSMEAYTTLAKVYEKGQSLAMLSHDSSRPRRISAASGASLQKAIAEGSRYFEEDQNRGLVKQLEAAFLGRRIQRLGDIFASVTVGAIVDILGLEGGDASGVQLVASELRRIDASGALVVHIQFSAGGKTRASALAESAGDHVGAVAADDEVHFDTPSTEFSSLEAAQRLMHTMKESQRWMGLVDARERALASSEAYLSKLHASRERMGMMGTDDDDDAFAS